MRTSFGGNLADSEQSTLDYEYHYQLSLSTNKILNCYCATSTASVVLVGALQFYNITSFACTAVAPNQTIHL